MKLGLAWLATILVETVAMAAPPDGPGEAFFEQKVRPILVASCAKCHGAKKQESGLRLDARAALIQGGDNGPAVVPGDPAKSLLIQAVNHEGDLAMPPGRKLSDEQIGVLKQWVERGMPWPGGDTPVAIRSSAITDEDRRFWSFQPVAAKPAVPTTADRAWPRTEIDAFILARLETEGLKPAAPADRRTLIRRASFDLIGLPPTPAEVAAFVADPAPDAFARVVDRLLASPRYGERWGRHWLDVVRYADTAGETADFPVREAHLYRDYVIDAFNRDTPYDQFVREQVAGDLIAATDPARHAKLVTATGFIATSRRFGFDPQNYQHLTIQDTIDTVGQTVLGLSLGCARCHDHKFDPISAADYYALYGIFDSTRYAFPGSEEKNRPRDLVPLVPPVEAAAKQKSYDETLARLTAEIKESDARRATAEQARTALQQAGPFPMAYGVTEGSPHDARVQKRGEPTMPGEEVPRRFLQILGGDRVPPGSGSGRLALADWLTRPTNPLTPRVMVNRVWQHHFGRGLVATENDFGRRGLAPTHPELLDDLARRFINGGWSVKSLHRLIMLSSVYQSAGAGDSAADRLARFPRRRLDAEEIRDAMLFTAGTLDTSPAGPHPFPPVESWGFTQHSPFAAVYPSNRRSVYLMTQRLKRHPYLALFDGPDPNSSTPHRSATTVPTQALFFMNDPFVHEQAAALARRLLTAEPDDRARLRLAFETTLSRPPSADDESDALGFLAAERNDLASSGVAPPEADVLAWSALARTLYSRNEFLFID
ncbi:Planctomycete cytochrome C [Singulisphaera sp. GP187]|uniref:PSD1 and planctomycete cytochrome C domain-containing protein n=1 Tax=Singulisphaera sp. GP187 TaxID=1882752 RepID=UPI00092958A8|nr:PSD1 and planctomycete cytochrome C domain-containing protein [Singulisphaera sp. GP187]SIO59037.1 Planctomycete cytochrome C [Singulisphaera sp. GP187]